MIEHSREFRRIKRIHDKHPDFQNLNLEISQHSYYLIEVCDGEDKGVWFFHKYDDGLMVHVNFDEDYRGKVVADSARNAFKWVFENTDTKIIYALIFNTNRHVQMLACAVGFSLCYKADTDRLYTLEAA